MFAPGLDSEPQPRASAIYSFERPTTGGAFIRGSLFYPVPIFVKERFGDQQWERFLRQLDPLAAQAFREGLEALAWYPFEIIASVVDSLFALGGATALRNVAFNNLEHSTKGIFRAIFKVGSPEFMLARSDQVWRRYYSKGRMEVLTATRGQARVRLRDFREITPNYSRVVMHSMEAVIVKAGAKDAACETVKDIAAGDQYSEYHYTWR